MQISSPPPLPSEGRAVLAQNGVVRKDWVIFGRKVSFLNANYVGQRCKTC